MRLPRSTPELWHTVGLSSPTPETYRQAIADFIREQARPVDKFSHQPRLYAVAREVGDGLSYDDEILYAAAWLHDLGVFYGRRPADLEQLARWDNVAYAVEQAPPLLARFGFPAEKIPGVLHAIETHQPTGEPQSTEAVILRDADILEQLGAVGILRTVSKVGRDTRFQTFADALALLEKNLRDLPSQLRLAAARRLAAPRILSLEQFLTAAHAEAQGIAL